ncbi:phage tail tape measure protein [Alcaligenes endophyticus]|uniref:Phage tail tape measure protein n=1 Tax=Alcaligenes endophyticus TaxID=1929088 RepID=A0ABT8EJ61_9BURK|nr:phage tail tape measure protein [Alcaligenes endophyticus]MCX5592543.1 phage tail tape measure protein [Alcaligenes endophyticus]MDN4121270.1 phage tail tape measure protein [Alcaligenes endophyticus]
MSMTLAELQLEIDSRRVKEAQKELDRLAQSADKAEGATDSLNRTNKEAEDRYKSIAQAAVARQLAMQEEVRSMRESNSVVRKTSEGWQERARTYTAVASAERKVQLAQERQEAAMKAAAEAADKNRSSLEKLLNQIDPLEGKLSRLDRMEKQLNQSFRQGILDVDTYAQSLAKIAGQRSAISDQQMKQVADGAGQAVVMMDRLGLSTTTARYNLLLLARAAASGDIRQAGSSILRLGSGVDLLSGVSRGAALSVGSLVAAIGASAGAMALYERGAQEARNYNIALIDTGRIAGVSGGQLEEMARRISDSEAVTRAAAAVLVELTANARLSGRDIEVAGQAIYAMSQLTGRGVSDMAGEFAALRRDPVQALLDLNEQYGYLSLSTLNQVRALEREGRQQEAVSVAVRAHADMMQQRAPQIAENINVFTKAWLSAKSAANDYFSAAAKSFNYALGGARPVSDIKSDLDEALQERDRELAGVGRGLDRPIKWIQANVFGKEGEELADKYALTDIDEKIRKLRIDLEAAEKRERDELERGRLQETQNAGLAGSSFLDHYAERSKSDYAKALEIQKIKRSTTAAIMADGENAAHYLKLEKIALDEVEKRFKPAGSNKQADVSVYRRQLQSLVDDFRNANSILDSERRAGNISEEEYWQKKISLIDQNEAAQKIAMHGELERLSRTKNSAKQRADIEAQLAKISKEADRDRQLAANGQKEAMHKAEIAITAYIDALNQLVKAEERAGQQRLAGMGLGSRERELQAGLDGADARFAQEQVNLSRDLDSKNINQGEYEKKLAGIRQAHQSLRDQLVANYHAIREAEGNWLLGSQEGLRNYADEAANAYKVAADFSHSFARNMENAIMDLATTSDHSFKSVARSFGNLTASVLRDMARMALQQQVMGPLMGMLSSAFTPTLTMGGAAVSAAPSVDLSHSMGQFSFSSGGFTGVGGRYEPAGVVHKGEGVLNQDEIRALGGEAGFNALRRAIRGPGHSMGGMAGSPMLPPPVGRQAPAGGEPKVEIHIHNNGEVSSEATPGLEEFAKLMQQIARAEYQKLQVRSQRPGGISWNDSQRFV